MWVACQNNRRHDAEAHIDPDSRPFIWRARSRIEILNIVALVTMTAASSDQTTYPAFTSRIQQAFLSRRLLAQHIPCLRAAKGDRGCQDDVPIKFVLQSGG
jgi:hypothetical protein